MKRHTWLSRGAAVASVLTLGGLVTAFASCADSDSAPSSFEGERAPLPEAAAAEAGFDAGPDAACDPDSGDCTTEIVACEKVAWCLVTTPVDPLFALASVWGSSANDVWAVGSGGTIVHYDGTTWKLTPSNVHNTFFGVWGSGPGDVYAVSSTQVIVHSAGFTGGNATWSVVPTDNGDYNTAFVRAVWGSSANDVRIGGRAYDLATSEDGTGDQFVRRTTADGGIAWRPLPGSHTITSIWGSSATDVWMTADNSVYVSYERGKILHGTKNPDAGADAGPEVDPLVWTAIDSQSKVTLEAIWGSSAADVWAAGAVGTIRRFRTGDQRWQEVESPTLENLRGIWGSAADDVWMVGDAGTILHWNGTTLVRSSVQLPLGRKPRLNGVWGSGPNDVWVVGDGVTLHFTGPKPGVTEGTK